MLPCLAWSDSTLAGWTALPARDRRLLEWLISGEVVTAELAGLLAYGNLRIAQRRLKKLVDYGLVRGFWAANSQRPRGRYAYALTRATRTELERLMWGDRRPRAAEVEVPSPVIHQLATHDLFAAMLRASPLGDGIGLVGWVPERAIALAFGGYLRPDALALIGVDERAVALFIERDLGNERTRIPGHQGRGLQRPLQARSAHQRRLRGQIGTAARRRSAVGWPTGTPGIRYPVTSGLRAGSPSWPTCRRSVRPGLAGARRRPAGGIRDGVVHAQRGCAPTAPWLPG